MNIAQFGSQFSNVQAIAFRSKKALYDYDALVIDLNSIGENIDRQMFIK